MSIFDAIRRIFGGDATAPMPDGDGDSSGMITCMEAVTFMQEYLDGELDEVACKEVAAHFEACSRCYPHLQMEESFRTAVRRAAVGREAPPELKGRVVALLAELEKGP